VPGRPGLRSVDSECAGRVIEPRKTCSVAIADAVLVAEGSIPEPKHGQALGFAGVKERGTYARGWPRNLGGPDDSTTGDRWASGEQPRPEGDGRPPPSVSERRVAVVPHWRRKRSRAGRSSGSRSASLYLRSRGTQPARTLWREGGTGTWNGRRERRKGHRALPRINATPADSSAGPKPAKGASGSL